jgi:beta-phosphoglucomutase
VSTQMKNDPPFETILFDMDGVLVDSMALHRQSWQEIMSGFGIRLADEFIYRHEGAMGLEVLEGIFQQHRVEFAPDLLETIYELQNRLFRERYLDRVGLYPHTLPLLARCREKGIQLGLVTSSRLNLVERIWNEEQLRLFETVVTADRVERFKPNPDPYLRAMDDLGRNAGQCLVVENAPAGIQAAKAAGLTCFAVASTLSPEHLQEADQIFPDLDALATHLF